MLATSGAAGAPLRPTTVAIVEPGATSMMVGLSAQVASWAMEEAKAQGYAVVSPEDVARALGEARYAELQACRGERTCIAALALPLTAKRLVVGSLERDAQSYLVTLHLIELPTAAPLARLERAVRIATRRLGPELKLALGPFFRGEAPRAGLVELNASVEGAEVEVDGTFAGSTPLRLSLPPGRHEVSLEKPGYLAAHRWLTVAAGETTREEVTLSPIPNARPGQLALPNPTREPPAPLVPPSASELLADTRRPYRVPVGAWVSGGVAIAAAGAGLGFGLSSASLQRAMAAGRDPNSGVYAASRVTAQTARGHAIAANVLFASAGVAAVTALGFALFTPGDEGLRASFAAGPDGAAVALGGSF